MTTRTGSAHYDGLGPTGKGKVSSQSGVLHNQAYPEELIAAAHAAYFTMALSFALAQAGSVNGTLDTKAAVTLDKEGSGFKITKSALTLPRRTARCPSC